MNDHQSIEDKLILLELRAEERRLRASVAARQMIYDALERAAETKRLLAQGRLADQDLHDILTEQQRAQMAKPGQTAEAWET